MDCGSWVTLHHVLKLCLFLMTGGERGRGRRGSDTWWDEVIHLLLFFNYLFSPWFQAVLVKSREQVADELSRLQRDNESLQGKHRLHVELQQQEDFQMPSTVQVCETHRTFFSLCICIQSFTANNDAEYAAVWNMISFGALFTYFFSFNFNLFE